MSAPYCYQVIEDCPEECCPDEHVTTACPACGEYPDYCQGHGEMGDPVGHDILTKHDNGDHTECVSAFAPFLHRCEDN